MKPIIVTLASLLLLSGCAQTRSPAYADAYRDALLRQQGTTAITPDMTERFVAFFSHASASPPAAAAEGSAAPAGQGSSVAADVAAAARGPSAEQLYGDPLYFSDTLLTTNDRDVAIAHLERMRVAAESIRVEVIDSQIDGQDVYLIWQMEMIIEPGTRAVTSNTIGMTHLRFDADGRIILQQDFWDSAEGLYRHVPVVGGLIGMVRNQVGGDDD